jgi:hypothetical protein
MVAMSNADLQRVIDEVVDVPGVHRLASSIALSTPIPPRVRPLLERLLPHDHGGRTPSPSATAMTGRELSRGRARP